jgi:hypothetical protein
MAALTPLEIALSYIDCGWTPLPVPYRTKKPVMDDWQTFSVTKETAAKYFNGGKMNIGVLMGPRSGNLSDVDLDTAEAVAIAPYLLPKTGAIFGRESKRSSHRLYVTDLASKHDKAAFQFDDPDTDERIVELRIGGGGKGAQTVFPGSVHESGESIAWEQTGAAAAVDGSDLLRRVRALAAYCMAARGWPEPGKRHKAACVLGGFLARTGRGAPTVKIITEAIARAAGDEEWRDRVKAAEDAANAYAVDKNTYGFPALAELLGKKTASKVAELLDYDSTADIFTKGPRANGHDTGADTAEPATNEPKAGANSTGFTAKTGPAPAGSGLNDFLAYLPAHTFCYVPTREFWVTASIDDRFGTVEEVTAEGTTIKTKASKWLSKNRGVAQATWAPGLPMLVKDCVVIDGGWIDQPGETVLNLYRPPPPVTGNATLAQPWVDHVRKVYPDDADHIIAWLAQRVQTPANKINHVLMLGGAPGIGKDTMLEPVKRAVGPWNFSEVTPQQMLGRFNGFVKSVILRISEARDLGEVNRYSFYEHIKIYAAAPPDTILVDEKHLRAVPVFNCTGVVITTNYRTDAIYLPPDDRRHYVAWSTLTEESFPAGYWPKLWRWYEDGGFGHVAAYLASLDLTGFNPKAPPRKTDAFWSIVDANVAPEDGELADALDRLADDGRRPDAVTLPKVAAVADAGFGDWLRDRKNRRIVPHRFESCGYTPVRSDIKSGLWVVAGTRQVVYAKTDLSMRERIAAARALASGY